MEKTMSAISKDSLKNSLLELECHFTWILSKEDVDLDELEETIYDQIRFMIESNIQNYNLLSYVCHLKNSNEEALRSLQNAEENVKKNHPDEIARRSLVTWGNYAWVYYHMERYKEAQIYVNKVKKSCKKLSSTAGGTICLPEISAEKGWALLKFGRKYYERAKESFKNALQIEPNNPEFSAGYAITMYRLEYHSHEEYEDEHTSINLLKRAVELNPKATFVMSLLALKLQDLGQADEGEKYMEEALQEAPCLPYVLRYAAKFYRRKGNVDKAVEVLEKALKITPSSSFLHHQLGLCYRAKLFSLRNTTGYTHQQEDNIIHQAIFHFKAALDRKTKFFCGHLDLADMYAKAKQYEKAEEMFQKALQINILSDNDQQEFCYHYGNFQLYHRKSESEAIRYYVKGLKIETKSSYWILKIINALKKLLERRIQRGLGDATDFGTLGFVHNLNGQKQEAVECYEQAIALCPDNEEYLSALCELRLSI